MKNKEKVSNKIGIIKWSVAIILIIITSVALLMANDTAKKMDNSEAEMERLTTQYYERNIKGKVFGVNRQKVTVQALEDAGYDVSKISVENKEKAYAFVIIADPHEKDVDKIEYKIEVHLNEE